MRSGNTMSAFSICSTRSSTVSTTGRTSVPTNMQPSPSHLPTRMPWSGDEPAHDGTERGEHLEGLVVAERVVHAREAAHVDEGEAPEDAHAPQFGRAPGPRTGSSGLPVGTRGSVAAGRVDAVDPVEQVGAAPAVGVDLLPDAISASRSLASSGPAPGAPSSSPARVMAAATTTWSRRRWSTSGGDLDRCRRAARRTGRRGPR